SDTTTIVAGSDLTIAKSHSGNFVQGHIGSIYTITASNVGAGATNGTVTGTDTLPTGPTPPAMSRTGWGCPPPPLSRPRPRLPATAMSGTGWVCTLATLTCTRTDALAASAAYPAITLTVNVASNAPASVTNTATVSGGGDVNGANNSVNDPTTIVPPTTVRVV